MHLTEGGSLWEGQASRCCLAKEAPRLAPLIALGTTLYCQAPAQVEQSLSAHLCSHRSVTARTSSRCICSSVKIKRWIAMDHRPEACSRTAARGQLWGAPKGLPQARHACILGPGTEEPGRFQL